jgi:phosphatidylglycerophosphate synthase
MHYHFLIGATMTSLPMADIAVASLRPPKIPPIHHIDPPVAVSQSSALPMGVVVTLVRAPLAALGVWAVASGAPIIATALFVAFATIDLFDGVIARSHGEETALRRTTDVVIDRVGIHSAIIAMTIVNGFNWTIPVLFIARDVAQAIYSSYIVKRYRRVIVGPHSHMVYGLTMLAWGCISINTHFLNPILTAATGIVSAVVLVDYVRRSQRLLHMTNN